MKIESHDAAKITSCNVAFGHGGKPDETKAQSETSCLVKNVNYMIKSKRYYLKYNNNMVASKEKA